LRNGRAHVGARTATVKTANYRFAGVASIAGVLSIHAIIFHRCLHL
jgi:hypothetical protein